MRATKCFSNRTLEMGKTLRDSSKDSVRQPRIKSWGIRPTCNWMRCRCRSSANSPSSRTSSRSNLRSSNSTETLRFKAAILITSLEPKISSNSTCYSTSTQMSISYPSNLRPMLRTLIQGLEVAALSSNSHKALSRWVSSNSTRRGSARNRMIKSTCQRASHRRLLANSTRTEEASPSCTKPWEGKTKWTICEKSRSNKMTHLHVY